MRIAAESGDRSLTDQQIAAEAYQRATATISAQENSLAEWVWYITRPQHAFSNSYIALVFKSLIARSNNSINPYPSPHSTVLKNLSDAYEPYLRPNSQYTKETKDKLKGFSKAYDDAVRKSDEALAKLREGSDVQSGKWFDYTSKDVSKIMALCKDTPLCLKYKEWAEFYTSGGRRLRLFLTRPVSEDPRVVHDYSMPRVALCYTGTGKKRNIYEMHGVEGANQDLENIPALAEKVEEESANYVNGEGYAKKARDIRALLKLKKKIKNEKENKYKLTASDLRRLYEIDERFEHLGRGGQQSGASELRKGRDAIADAISIFGSIAQLPDQITSDTKAYIGPLSDAQWKKILAIESERVGKGDSEKIRVYKDSFPDGKRARRGTVLEQTTPKVIKDSLNEKGVAVVGHVGDMIDRIPKEDLDAAGSFELITLQVRDLFTAQELADMHNRVTAKDFLLIANPRTDAEKEQNKKVRKRYEALGIDLCPATVASNILADEAKEDSARTFPPGHWEYVASETISGRDGSPYVFGVERHDHGTLELGRGWAGPDGRWGLDDGFVFRLRK